MIDPITAAAAATKAYAGVKAFIEAGKSIEDTFSVVARWQGHASDVLYANKRQEKRTNPLKKVVFADSIEAEAAQMFAAKKRIETQKRELIENMDYLSKMSVEEQTLYKKWVELQEPSMIRDKSQIAELYPTQWAPTDINNLEQTIKEIEALEPYVEIIEDAKDSTKWTYLRRMIHTMGFTANPGRNVKINIHDS